MRAITNEMAEGAEFQEGQAAAVQALFDSMAAGWHAHDVPERLVALEDVFERIDLPEGVLVELGAGTGFGTKVISRFRPVDAAVDLSAGMLAQAPAATPIHLSADAVVEALPGKWHAEASRAGSGTWCVARRAPHPS